MFCRICCTHYLCMSKTNCTRLKAVKILTRGRTIFRINKRPKKKKKKKNTTESSRYSSVYLVNILVNILEASSIKSRKPKQLKSPNGRDVIK